MISKAAQYRSYYEVAKKIKNPEARLAFYDALDTYRFEGIEPENLPIEADIAFTAIKANIDADLGRKHAGAPAGNQNARKTPNSIEETEKQLQNNSETIKNNSKQLIDLEKTNNVNDNDDVNEDVEADGNTHTVRESGLFGLGKIQKQCFDMIQEHNKVAPKERKIPCSNNLMSFVQKESRELFDTIGTEEPPEKVIAALQNYIKVAQSDTWQKTFSWRSFCKNYQNYSPDFFSLTKYLNTEPETEDATKKPEYLFYMKMRTNTYFHVETFQAHIEDWKAEGRPEGALYIQLQNKWEQEAETC